LGRLGSWEKRLFFEPRNCLIHHILVTLAARFFIHLMLGDLSQLRRLYPGAEGGTGCADPVAPGTFSRVRPVHRATLWTDPRSHGAGAFRSFVRNLSTSSSKYSILAFNAAFSRMKNVEPVGWNCAWVLKTP
jgi:hypothetical protein